MGRFLVAMQNIILDLHREGRLFGIENRKNTVKLI